MEEEAGRLQTHGGVSIKEARHLGADSEKDDNGVCAAEKRGWTVWYTLG